MSSFLKQPRAVWAVAFACVIAFMGIGLVDPILKEIAVKLDTTPSQVSLLFTSYMAIMGISMLVTGVVSSRIGPKRTLLAGLVLIIVFAGLAGLSGSVGAVIGFRAGWGLGNALFVATALSTIVSSSRGSVAQAIILFEAALGLGIASGPLIGGLLGRGGITRLHGEMGISVVAPIIHEAVLLQMIFIGMQRQGQQLDGGDAEAFQMADYPLVGQRAISAGIGQIGKLFGKPFDMRFVNHGVCPRRVWVLIVAPIEFRRPLHHAFGGHGGIVAGIVKSKMRQRFGIVITRPARHARGIRVEQ